MWGAIHSYLAVEPKDTANTMNYLVMGPWRHSGVNYDGTTLGPLKFDGDTALQFRRDVLKPFFDQYLKEGAPKAATPPVFIYNTGENQWDRLKKWPLACETRLCGKVEAALPAAGLRPVVHAAGRRQWQWRALAMTSTFPIRPSPSRTCRGPCASPTASCGAAGW